MLSNITLGCICCGRWCWGGDRRTGCGTITMGVNDGSMTGGIGWAKPPTKLCPWPSLLASAMTRKPSLPSSTLLFWIGFSSSVSTLRESVTGSLFHEVDGSNPPSSPPLPPLIFAGMMEGPGICIIHCCCCSWDFDGLENPAVLLRLTVLLGEYRFGPDSGDGGDSGPSWGLSMSAAPVCLCENRECWCGI